MLVPLAGGPREIRDFFTRAGFDHEQFKNNRALQDLPSRHRGNLPVLEAQLADPTPLNVLLRWFFLGLSQESESAAKLIPGPVTAQLLEAGALRREGGLLVPVVMLTPCDGGLFAADPVTTLESEDSAGMILWPNPSTRMLQMFTIRRPSGATLDLGTGCGILAVFAAYHSRHVVATDLNPRAAEFVRFNAWLNGVDNIEYLTGDTFQPVQGRTFDLIACNPPFFVTPSSGQMYCENSMELDGYCRDLVRAAPAYLNEGGFLQITFEWVQVSGQTWRERLAGWLKDSGCDAWILRSYVRSAESYAAERISRMMPFSAESASSRLAEWKSYYQDRNVEEIQGGVLAMRRRSGKNWLRIEEMPNMECPEPFGDDIEELFASQDRLETDQSVDQMLAWRPRLSEDTRLDQQSKVVQGRWQPVNTQFKRIGVLPSSLAADPQVADFVRQCDGSRTVSELADSLAASVKVDAAVVRQQCCAIVRKLVERRLVVINESRGTRFSSGA